MITEDPLAKFLEVSYKWLSKYTLAPSIEEFEQFVEENWRTFDGRDVIPVELQAEMTE